MDFGGPDNFGFTWQDSDEPGGPVFTWVNIVDIGIEVTWEHGDSDDGHTNPIPMGMTFNFYGANYDSMVISTNGWVSFLRAPDDPFGFVDNGVMPSNDELQTLLAVDWDNLDGGNSGHCYYYHNTAANSFIVSWVNWSHKPEPTNQHDFQLILNGSDGTITFQYGSGTFQNDVTIGIENEAGDDGLVAVFNESYLHNNLAIQFSPPIFWLSTNLADGVLPTSGIQDFEVYMLSAGLPTGTYNGAIIISSNDIDQPVSVIDVLFEIEGICNYVPGDVNGSGEANGIDVTFMVTFFKGGNSPHEECPPCDTLGTNMIYPQGDVNGNCSFNGIDVTYFVAYLKGLGPALRFCDSCPPAGGSTAISAPVHPALSPIKKVLKEIR
jgi:hypothetical protein